MLGVGFGYRRKRQRLDCKGRRGWDDENQKHQKRLRLENCVQMPEKEVLCQFPLIHDFSLIAYAILIPLLHRENGVEARPHGI